MTDIQIRNAKFTGKQQKLSDGGGLFLLVNAAGKYWCYSYRFQGKQKTMALGVYPETPLSKARDKHIDAKCLLADGIDPSAYQKSLKLANKELATNNFEAIAREWHVKQSPKWSPNTAKRIIQRLEQHIFPWLGKKPIADIIARDVLEVVHRIEAQGKNETAQRGLNYCSQNKTGARLPT